MSKGVQFTAPPPDRIGPIMEAVNRAAASLAPGTSGAIVGIVNEKGANAAIVVKRGETLAVTSWIGKTWTGSLEYGAAIKKTW